MMIYFLIFLIGCYLSLATYVANFNNIKNILISENSSYRKSEFYKDEKHTILIVVLLSWFCFIINLITNYSYRFKYRKLKIELVNWKIRFNKTK
jgi:hypothetical protein